MRNATASPHKKVTVGGICSFTIPKLRADIPAPPTDSGSRKAVRPCRTRIFEISFTAGMGNGAFGSLRFRMGVISPSITFRTDSWICLCSLVSWKSIMLPGVVRYFSRSCEASALQAELGEGGRAILVQVRRETGDFRRRDKQPEGTGKHRPFHAVLVRLEPV